MSQGQHPFEGPPILYVPGAPPIEPRGCIDGLFRGHLSQWATRNILSQGCLSHGCMPQAQELPSCTRTAHILAGRAVARSVAGGIRPTWEFLTDTAFAQVA